MIDGDGESLRFEEHGAQLFRGAVVRDLSALLVAIDKVPTGRAGVRLNGLTALNPYLNPEGTIGNIVTSLIGPKSKAVRAILFDKSEETNWSLAWHQDRTICVRRKVEVEGFGPWTRKGGMQHVAPPFDVLSRMVTLRVHFDDVPPDNAPLLVAPGSHREGRVSESEISRVVKRRGIAMCLAVAGDVWAYSTPILHASDASAVPGRRRVLQIDFAAENLPGGLEWLGI